MFPQFMNAALMALGVFLFTSVDGVFHIRQLNPPMKRQSNFPMEQEQMCFTIPHLQALKEQFATYIDSNGDERASMEEVLSYLRKYNPDVTPRQVREFIARRDKDGDGSVDFIPDYLMEVSSPDFDVATAKEWFSLEDTNGDGYVTRDELINIATKVGMPPEEARQTVNGFYMAADANGDGKLSWTEYQPLFTEK